MKKVAIIIFIITISGLISYKCAISLENKRLSPSDVVSKTVPSVVRILRKVHSDTGTGFVHKSGYIITASHVVYNSFTDEIVIYDYNNNIYSVKSIVCNPYTDLAIIKTNEKINLPAVKLDSTNMVKIGSEISTLGYPSGYEGNIPLLCMGYISGLANTKRDDSNIYKVIILNAAINGGNSGGPLIDLETNNVIGVITSKLAPIPPYIVSALNAMKNNNSGVLYKKEYSDGKTSEITEGQVIEEVLQYLRSQIQLVIGIAANCSDLQNLLKANGIEP